MRVLASICNKKPDTDAEREEPALLPGVFLFAADTETGEVEPVPCKWWWRKAPKGVCGLTRYGDGVLAVFQSRPTMVLHLDRDWKVQGKWKAKLAHSPHSVAVHEGKFYIGSTGNDAVVELDPATGAERFCWRANDGEEDSIHVNAVFWHGDDLCISCFGPRGEDGMWSSAVDGTIRNLTQDSVMVDGIYHPHTASWQENEIWWCESSRQIVHRRTGDQLAIDRGYTRGLVVTPDRLVVGVSGGRRRSQSTGKKVQSRFTRDCGMLVYERRGPGLGDCVQARWIDLEPWGNEIYDVVGLG